MIFSGYIEKYKRLAPDKRQWFALSAVCILAFGISISLFSLDLVRVLEWKIVDSWIHRTGDTVPNKDIVVLEIDEEFVEQEGWPIDKNIYGVLLDFLNEMGAKVIALDVLFSNNTDPCNEGDSIFVGMIQYVKNTVLIYSPIETTELPLKKSIIPENYSVGKGHVPGYSINKIIMPYDRLLEAGPMIGHHNLAPPYRDGSYRQIPLFISSAGLLFPTLSLISVSLYKDNAQMVWDRKKNRLAVGDLQVPVDEQTNLLIDFRYKITRLSMLDVFVSHQQYLNGQTPEIGRKELEGKIIFIGVSDPLQGDNAITPMSKDMTSPKVLLHARSAATILNSSGIRNSGRPGGMLVSLFILAVMLTFFKMQKVKFCYFIFAILVVVSYIGGMLLYNMGYLVPIAEGVAAGILFTLFASLVIFFEKDAARNFLFDSFKAYLSKEVINDMYMKRVRPQLGGSEGIHTAFFTDIQSFSTFSEKIGSPTQLVELLNEYLSAMTDILMQNQGTLDKYEGDAIIAFFGAPLEMPDHALKACRTGIMMQEKLAELRKKWEAEGEKWPAIVRQMRMRIGINTGPIVTGNMGSRMRMNYTMMGDAVNLAARLESAAKQYGVFTLVSEETMKQARGLVYGRKIDVIRVVGKSRPVEIYEILGMNENRDPGLKKCIELFDRGREFYDEQKWDKAIALFTQCLEYEPHHPEREPGCRTTPSHVYIKRCLAFKESPPGTDWDGVYTAKEK
jgi:class 3 adenylate cyclase/CHASE2 domain-containing sensor protein